MAAKLGGVFVTCAIGPVTYAGACIQASKMPQGLEELAPEGLWGGFQRGLEQTAKLVGVTPRDVESVLPMGEIRGCLDRVAVSHRAALAAWQLYAGQLGGLLQGIADLTVDGRAPDASVCLARLARKVRRDRPFSEPLQALSDDIGQWQDLMTSCRKLLDEGSALKQAYRRRRLRNALAIGISAGLLAAVTVVLLIVRAARARVDELLAVADPCAVRNVQATDLDRASGDQQRAVTERLRACEEGEARAAREAAEKKAREEREAEVKRQREELEAKCAALAGRLAGGQLAPEDEELAGAGAPLLRRVRDKAVTPEDLGPEKPKLPCLGAPGAEKIVAAYGEAAVKTVWTWAARVDPSDVTREALLLRADDVPPRAKVMISLRATDTAKKAMEAGDELGIERALRLCALADELGMPGGKECAAAKAQVDKDR